LLSSRWCQGSEFGAVFSLCLFGADGSLIEIYIPKWGLKSTNIIENHEVLPGSANVFLLHPVWKSMGSVPFISICSPSGKKFADLTWPACMATFVSTSVPTRKVQRTQCAQCTQCTWFLHQYAGSTVSKDPARLAIVISPIWLLVVALASVFVKPCQVWGCKNLGICCCKPCEGPTGMRLRNVQNVYSLLIFLKLYICLCLFILFFGDRFAEVPSQRGNAPGDLWHLQLRFLKRRTVHQRTRVRARTETKRC
jgi:hypothetical protein